MKEAEPRSLNDIKLSKFKEVLYDNLNQIANIPDKINYIKSLRKRLKEELNYLKMNIVIYPHSTKPEKIIDALVYIEMRLNLLDEAEKSFEIDMP